MQEKANDAKQSRCHDESGGTTRLAICPARRPPPREAAKVHDVNDNGSPRVFSLAAHT